MNKSIESILKPDADLRKSLDQGANADINLCWTCGSCDFECPVNRVTGRLRPQQIVRMATYGMLDELVHEPSIWYCLTCRRCLQICPNSVKPSNVIAHVRQLALEKNIYSIETSRAYWKLFARFQRVRSHAVLHCYNEELKAVSDHQWCDWLLSPIENARKPIRFAAAFDSTGSYLKNLDHTRSTACFTCGECSSACPVACESSVFDPRTIFRIVNLGLSDVLLNSPAIWLCIDCGRCTDACSQLVDGREIIRRLKDLAFEEGVIDRSFFERLEKANRLVYARWLDEVNTLFGFNRSSLKANPAQTNEFSVCCREYPQALSA